MYKMTKFFLCKVQFTRLLLFSNIVRSLIIFSLAHLHVNAVVKDDIDQSFYIMLDMTFCIGTVWRFGLLITHDLWFERTME